jgi:hypothetical protein
MKQTAFRLTEEDLALLDEAKRRSGLLSRTEALRLVLREWARSVGFELESRQPKRRSKK